MALTLFILIFSAYPILIKLFKHIALWPKISQLLKGMKFMFVMVRITTLNYIWIMDLV